MTGAMLGRRHFEDSLGTCMFTTRTFLSSVCRALNAVTGWDYTKEEAMDFGKRCSHLMRLFNLRSGVGMDLEKPSERYWSTPVDGPAAGTERQGELGYPGGHLLRHSRMGPGDGKPPSGDPPQV